MPRPAAGSNEGMCNDAYAAPLWQDGGVRGYDLVLFLTGVCECVYTDRVRQWKQLTMEAAGVTGNVRVETGSVYVRVCWTALLCVGGAAVDVAPCSFACAATLLVATFTQPQPQRHCRIHPRPFSCRRWSTFGKASNFVKD